MRNLLVFKNSIPSNKFLVETLPMEGEGLAFTLQNLGSSQYLRSFRSFVIKHEKINFMDLSLGSPSM
jgi:hypothetical protein